MASHRISNVTLTDTRDGLSGRLYADCVEIRGVERVEFSAGGPADLPRLIVTIVAPALARRPTVRRKCLTRPHQP